MAVLELLARATEAWVVAAGNEHLVNRSSRIVVGVSRRCTAGKPVRMDVAGGWRYQFHERLMSRIGILVSLAQQVGGQSAVAALATSSRSGEPRRAVGRSARSELRPGIDPGL